MAPRIAIITASICFILQVNASASVIGTIRNDSVWMVNDSLDFSNVLEGKIIVEEKSDDLKFYADLRFFVYAGQAALTAGHHSGYYDYDVKLMRAFVRYFSPIGDLTIGKTYINFGNPGLFNLFDFDKSVNMSDTGYDKNGIVALEYVFYAGDSFEGKYMAGCIH